MNMEMTLVSDFVTFSFDRGLAKLTPIVFLLQFGHQKQILSPYQYPAQWCNILFINWKICL